MRLHWKLMTTYVIIVVLVLASVHLYLNDVLKEHLADDIAAHLARETRLAVELWRAEGGAVDARAVDALADRIGARLGLRATVIDGEGRVLGDSEVATAELPDLENHADRPEVIDARASGLGQSQRYSATLQRHMLYVARAVSDLGDGRTVVRLAMPLTDVEEIQGHIDGALWVASLLGISLSFILVYGASRFASRPIEQLTSTARSLARSETPVEVAVPAVSARELRDLGRAMAEMHEQIRHRVGQIRTENARLEAILNSASEGILVTDLEGRTVLANDPLLAMFGVDAWREGCRPVELVRISTVQDAIAATLASCEPSSFEVTVNGPPERFLDTKVAPITQDGSCQGTVTVFHDITGLRRLERVRRDFVANVSHELRTPLTAIKGCAETLADGALDDPPAATRFIDVIGNHVNRLSNLLNDLLNLSRLESDNLQLEPVPVSLRHLVEAATDAVAELAAEKRIAVEAEVDGPLESAGDRQLIEQALINLLDNAVKYTPEDGQVRLSDRVVAAERVQGELSRRGWCTGPGLGERQGASRDDGVVEASPVIFVEVADTGIGIPSDSIDRVFERFYRVDTSRSREMGGTGLGLAIVRHIIEAHGQRVFVDSELGQGSTFGFTLPLAS